MIIPLIANINISYPPYSSFLLTFSAQATPTFTMTRLISALLFTSLAFASPLSPEAANLGTQQAAAAVQNGKPKSEGVTTFDGVTLANIQQKPSVQAATAGAISRTGWTITADSSQSGNPATNAIDGNSNTFWHTMYSPTTAPLPHQITVDMKSSYLIGSITYQPRQDGNSNGNIGQHVISVR